MALAASRGAPVTVLCLTYGERGESARAWRDGMELTEIKEQVRRRLSRQDAYTGNPPSLLRLARDRSSHDPGSYGCEKRTAVHHVPSPSRLSAATSSSLTSRTLAACRRR